MGSTSFPFIVLTGITLVLLFLLFLFMRSKKQGRKLSPLAGAAFGFILAGIYFGEQRNVGYPLIGIGIILAVADIINKPAGKEEEKEQ